jgi:hypothetical protein
MTTLDSETVRLAAQVAIDSPAFLFLLDPEERVIYKYLRTGQSVPQIASTLRLPIDVVQDTADHAVRQLASYARAVRRPSVAAAA